MSKGHFSIVPDAVYDDSSCSSTETLVLLVLLSYADSTGKCWPSLASIARRSKFSTRTVIRTLESLEKMGKIRKTKRLIQGKIEADSNVYHIGSDTMSLPSDTMSQEQYQRINNIFDDDSLNPSVSSKISKSEKPKKPAGRKKPDPLPPDQLEAFHNIEGTLKAEAEKSGVTWNPPREAKSLRNLVEAYASKLDRLPFIVATYLGLRKNPPRGNETFWNTRAPLPSALVGVLGQVETIAASLRPAQVREEKKCARCGKPIRNSSGECQNRECQLAALAELENQETNV